MIARIKKFYREIKLEWSKVSKPDWKDVRGNTLVVIVACAIIGVFLWFVDGGVGAPEWISIHGIIMLAGILVVVPLIARRYTPKWKLAIPIAAIPSIVVLFSYFVLKQDSLRGFGLALLRSWFIRSG
jgi:preprotein translocase SecE subunit